MKFPSLKISHLFILFLVLGFSLPAHAANFNSVYSPSDAGSCPHDYLSFNCGSNYVVDTAGNCELVGDMTTAYNGCVATDNPNNDNKAWLCGKSCIYLNDTDYGTPHTPARDYTCNSKNRKWSNSTNKCGVPNVSNTICTTSDNCNAGWNCVDVGESDGNRCVNLNAGCKSGFVNLSSEAPGSVNWDENYSCITLVDTTKLSDTVFQIWDSAQSKLFDIVNISEDDLANNCSPGQVPSWNPDPDGDGDSSDAKWECTYGGPWKSDGSGNIHYDQGNVEVKNVPPTTSFFYADATGQKVGINTETPNSTLDVHGDIAMDDYIRHNNDENTYIGFSGNNKIKLATNNTGRLYIFPSGEVSIASTAANGALFVNGEIKGWGVVPIGTIMDWYCPHSSPSRTNCSPYLPNGWKIADGSTVYDSASLFNNRALPDLRNQFARGADIGLYTTNYSAMGTTGGSATASVPTHDHSISGHTHTGPSHRHTGPSHRHTGPSHTHSIGSHSHTLTDHNHAWVQYLYSTKNWYSWAWTGTKYTMINWSDGIHGDGSGIYPMGTDESNDDFWYTDYSRKIGGGALTSTASKSAYNTSSSGTGNTGYAGTGNTGYAGTGATGSTSLTTANNSASSVDILPPYENLIKIIRIK